MVALEVTLESNVRVPQRAVPRPALRPPAERGELGWGDALAAPASPRLCPILLAATVVFALAAALACHFSQALPTFWLLEHWLSVRHGPWFQHHVKTAL